MEEDIIFSQLTTWDIVLLQVTNGDIIAALAVFLASISLGWNIVSNLVMDKANLDVAVRMGRVELIKDREETFFVDASEIPADQIKTSCKNLKILFTLTNVGRRPIVVYKLIGKRKRLLNFLKIVYKKHKLFGRWVVDMPGDYSFFVLPELQKRRLLQPYEALDILTANMDLVKGLQEGRIDLIYAEDTKGGRWYVPKAQIRQLLGNSQKFGI